MYAIYLDKGEKTTEGLPEVFTVNGIYAADHAKLNILGTNLKLKWENTNEGVRIQIPGKIRDNLPCDLAWAMRISEVK